MKFNMFDFRNFDDVFDFDPEYNYDASAIETIDRNRRSLEGLFVHKVLKLLGVKRRKSIHLRNNVDCS